MGHDNGRSPANGATISNGVSSPPPLWEKTPRPFWVDMINGVGEGIRRFGGSRWPRLSAADFMAELCSK